jgi:hypothetical protein
MPWLEIWQCNNCLETYDPEYLQDKPLVSTKDFKLAPYTDLQHYAQYDENDPTLPFVAAINVDDDQDQEDPNFQIVRPSIDQRIQHIRVKGLPTDVLRTMEQHENRISSSNDSNRER